MDTESFLEAWYEWDHKCSLLTSMYAKWDPTTRQWRHRRLPRNFLRDEAKAFNEKCAEAAAELGVTNQEFRGRLESTRRSIVAEQGAVLSGDRERTLALCLEQLTPS